MTFSKALKKIKAGRKVAREGWNGNRRAPVITEYEKIIPKKRLETFGDITYILGSKGNVAVFDTNLLYRLKGITKFTEAAYFTNTDNKTKTNTHLHTLLFDCPKGLLIDHINGNRLDNRGENIRFVTPAQNCQNRKSKKLYKGVHYDASKNKKYRASIQINGVQTHIGRFEEAAEAAEAYDKKAWEAWGEYAKLNFPEKELPARMFIYHVAAASYPAGGNTHGTMKNRFPDDMVPYQSHIDMKTADETVVPWLASQSDLLADDWEVID